MYYRSPTGLWVCKSAATVAEEEHQARLQRWRDYEKLHECCPACGKNDRVATTCLGMMEPPDMNRATCRCGWQGRVDGMVAALNPRQSVQCAICGGEWAECSGQGRECRGVSQ